MTWNRDAIGTRRVRTGRDRRVDIHEQLRELVRQDWFIAVVAELDEARPLSSTGRPRRHAHGALLLLYLASLLQGSQRSGETFLRSMNRWEGFRRLLSLSFSDDPCLKPGAPCPTRSALGYVKTVLDADRVGAISSHIDAWSLTVATELGLGINSGTMLEPSRQAVLFGDGIVTRAMTKYTPADRAVNPATGEIQARRHDPDARWHVTGDLRKVWGTHFAHLSGFTGNAGEHIIFGIRPVVTNRTEADIALELAEQTIKQCPGFAALTWDKALRSRHVDQLWDLRIQPVVGVYDKTGRHTDHIPLDEHAINGIAIRFVAHRGAVSIATHSGTVAPLEPVKLEYHSNKRGGQRVYGTFRIPEGTDCDTRLWGHTVRQRLNSRQKTTVVWGEHVRAHVPRSNRWNALYGNRSLAESMNSWLQHHFGPGQRARSLGRTGQWLDLVLLQAVRNTQSLMLYRDRVRREGTAAPPMAA